MFNWLLLAIIAYVAVLVFNLGAKRTAKDPDGSKHRLTFAVFVTVMVLVIGALAVVKADAARAGTPVCQGPVSLQSQIPRDLGPNGLMSVTLRVNRWCGTGRRSSARFTTDPVFVRDYTESIAWDFDRWFNNTSSCGYGTAPNGNLNVQFCARWVAAEFQFSSPPFQHSHPVGVRIWAWANGNYTMRIADDVPSGMPRP
jgi:hypothetical protein